MKAKKRAGELNIKVRERTYVLRIRAEDSWVFRAIKSGRKSVETRALGKTETGKSFGDVKKGDVLLFMCGEDRLRKPVKKVQKFKSVKSMLVKISYKKIWPHLKNPSYKEIEKIYYSYPGYEERIKKNGLIAVWI